MLKPFLKATTTKKIKIFTKTKEGDEKEKWREAILAEIDADQIRQRYGGTRPDVDVPVKITK